MSLLADFDCVNEVCVAQSDMDAEQQFPEMAHVRVLAPDLPPDDGHVLASQVRDGQRIYKVSLLNEQGTWENWYPEEWLVEF